MSACTKAVPRCACLAALPNHPQHAKHAQRTLATPGSTSGAPLCLLPPPACASRTACTASPKRTRVHSRRLPAHNRCPTVPAPQPQTCTASPKRTRVHSRRLRQPRRAGACTRGGRHSAPQAGQGGAIGLQGGVGAHSGHAPCCAAHVAHCYGEGEWMRRVSSLCVS